jgi:Flp pilus assembly protein CpaB
MFRAAVLQVAYQRGQHIGAVFLATVRLPGEIAEQPFIQQVAAPDALQRGEVGVRDMCKQIAIRIMPGDRLRVPYIVPWGSG